MSWRGTELRAKLGALWRILHDLAAMHLRVKRRQLVLQAGAWVHRAQLQAAFGQHRGLQGCVGVMPKDCINSRLSRMPWLLPQAEMVMAVVFMARSIYRGYPKGKVPAGLLFYFVSAFSASLMPSLTPTSAGSSFKAAAASLSL